MRTAQLLTVSVPPEILKEVDRVRKLESRTRSELVREALRTYFSRRALLEASVQRVGMRARRQALSGIVVEPLVAPDQLLPAVTVRGGADQARLRKHVKEGAIRNARRSLEMAKEWSVLEDEAWGRGGR